MNSGTSQQARFLESPFLSDDDVVKQLLGFIEAKSTFMGPETWKEPTENYLSQDRLGLELELIRQSEVVFCPSVAITETGSYLAREVAGVPLLAVRGEDGQARVFRNTCRHRGVQVAEGAGCTRAFVCPYHAWTYATDGSLRSVPHERGFPDLDKSTRGLVPVDCVERGGLLFVTQDGKPKEQQIPELPADLIKDNHVLLHYGEMVVDANWKLFSESFLESYHIRYAHKTTFYPIQFDNLSLVESFNGVTRLTVPYRSIEKLRNKALGVGNVDRYLTYVYHLFPNVFLVTIPGRINVVVLEPTGLDTTRMVNFVLGFSKEQTPTEQRSRSSKGPDYAKAQAEDQWVVKSAQNGLASKGNGYLEFGLFEYAIVLFYQRLERALASLSSPHQIPLPPMG